MQETTVLIFHKCLVNTDVEKINNIYIEIGTLTTMSLMDHLHWQHLLAKPLATTTRDSHLGQCNKKQKQSYLCCITKGGQGKSNGDCHVSPSSALSQAYRFKLCQCKHSLSQFTFLKRSVPLNTFIIFPSFNFYPSFQNQGCRRDPDVSSSGFRPGTRRNIDPATRKRKRTLSLRFIHILPGANAIKQHPCK